MEQKYLKYKYKYATIKVLISTSTSTRKLLVNKYYRVLHVVVLYMQSKLFN